MGAFVITRMYAGGYLAAGNLGLEIINLFKTDQGENYIFIGAWGMIDQKYDEKVKGVLLTRFVTKNCHEVLGLAKISPGGQVIKGMQGSRAQKLAKNTEQIKDYLSKHKVTYGGATFEQIYNGRLESCFTFRADELLIPKRTMLVTDLTAKDSKEDGTYNLKDKRFGSQALHMYIDTEKNPRSFATIEKMMEDESLWDKDKSATINKDKVVDNRHFNFLNIIKKENDELVFSNMISYFLDRDREMLKDFGRKVLAEKELGIEIDADAEIIREKDNIDILIEDKNRVIVIENKLKSEINGVEERHNFSDGHLIQSQLLKYYNLVSEQAKKDGRKAHFFVFLPNYSRIDISKYEGSKYYSEVRYAELYDFFRKYDDGKDKYFHDFCNALYAHTKDRDNNYYDEMEYMFMNRIRRATAK